MIGAGANVNKTEYGEVSQIGGITPAIVAAAGGHSKCLKLLIGAEADINEADEENRTPVYMAISRDHRECLKLLIDEGAELKHVVTQDIAL